MYLKFPKHISLQNQAYFFLNILAQVFKFTILWNQRQRVYIILIAAVYFSRRMTDECQDITYFMSIINITNPVIITRKKSDQSKTCYGQLQNYSKITNLPTFLGLHTQIKHLLKHRPKHTKKQQHAGSSQILYFSQKGAGRFR